MEIFNHPLGSHCPGQIGFSNWKGAAPVSWPCVRGWALISFKPSSANQTLTGQSIWWRALLMKPTRSGGSACCSSVDWWLGGLVG